MFNKSLLRTYRIARKLRQSDVSKMLGVTPSCYAMYERGEREPSIDTLKKISEIFHIDMNELTGVNPPSDIPLNNDEKTVLELFRSASPYQQEMILRMLDAAVSPKG